MEQQAATTNEIARNAHQYASGGRVEFRVELGPPPTLLACVVDQGPGIARLEDVLDGRYISSTGLGVGIVGARRIGATIPSASTIATSPPKQCVPELTSIAAPRVTRASVRAVDMPRA